MRWCSGCTSCGLRYVFVGDFLLDQCFECVDCVEQVIYDVVDIGVGVQWIVWMFGYVGEFVYYLYYFVQCGVVFVGVGQEVFVVYVDDLVVVLLEGCVVEFEFFQCVGFEVFDDDVGVCGQMLSCFGVFGLVQVDVDVLFVVVEHWEEVCIGVEQLLCVFVVDWFDFDYFGVYVGQYQFVGWVYYYVGEFYYVQVVKWLWCDCVLVG